MIFLNFTHRPDETMNAVVFGYDPPYEMLLIVAVLSVCAVVLLVSRPNCCRTDETDDQSITKWDKFKVCCCFCMPMLDDEFGDNEDLTKPN